MFSKGCKKLFISLMLLLLSAFISLACKIDNSSLCHLYKSYIEVISIIFGLSGGVILFCLSMMDFVKATKNHWLTGLAAIILVSFYSSLIQKLYAPILKTGYCSDCTRDQLLLFKVMISGFPLIGNLTILLIIVVGIFQSIIGIINPKKNRKNKS